MSKRARYETKTGESLIVSRGTLFITEAKTGVTTPHSIFGNVSYDVKTRQLSVPIQGGNLSFSISRDPSQIRAANRASASGAPVAVQAVVASGEGEPVKPRRKKAKERRAEEEAAKAES
jgi:hypothetical protein